MYNELKNKKELRNKKEKRMSYNDDDNNNNEYNSTFFDMNEVDLEEQTRLFEIFQQQSNARMENSFRHEIDPNKEEELFSVPRRKNHSSYVHPAYQSAWNAYEMEQKEKQTNDQTIPLKNPRNQPHKPSPITQLKEEQDKEYHACLIEDEKKLQAQKAKEEMKRMEEEKRKRDELNSQQSKLMMQKMAQQEKMNQKKYVVEEPDLTIDSSHIIRLAFVFPHGESKRISRRFLKTHLLQDVYLFLESLSFVPFNTEIQLSMVNGILPENKMISLEQCFETNTVLHVIIP